MMEREKPDGGEQIPEVWIGQEVRVGQTPNPSTGKSRWTGGRLEVVSERGLVLAVESYVEESGARGTTPWLIPWSAVEWITLAPREG